MVISSHHKILDKRKLRDERDLILKRPECTEGITYRFEAIGTSQSSTTEIKLMWAVTSYGGGGRPAGFATEGDYRPDSNIVKNKRLSYLGNVTLQRLGHPSST